MDRQHYYQTISVYEGGLKHGHQTDQSTSHSQISPLNYDIQHPSPTLISIAPNTSTSNFSKNGALEAQHLPPPFHLLRAWSPPRQLGHKTQRHRPRFLPPLRIMQIMSSTSSHACSRLCNKRRPLLSRMCDQ